MLLRITLVLSLATLFGCGGTTTADGGLDTPTRDAPVPDAEPTDSGRLDAPTALDAPSDLDAPVELDAPSDTPLGTDAQIADAPTAPASCDARLVLCDGIPPTCAEGEAPSVSGSCWGPCIPATTCTCTTAEECPDVPGFSETCFTGPGHCGPFL